MSDRKNESGQYGIQTLIEYYVEQANTREERIGIIRALEEFARRCEEIIQNENSEVHFHENDGPCRGYKLCPNGQYIPCDEPC